MPMQRGGREQYLCWMLSEAVNQSLMPCCVRIEPWLGAHVLRLGLWLFFPTSQECGTTTVQTHNGAPSLDLPLLIHPDCSTTTGA